MPRSPRNIAWLCVLIVTGGDAIADTDKPAPPLPEILVYGGARQDRALLDTPNAVSVVDDQDLLRRQPSTYEQLLGDQPGVTIEGGPRGVSQEINIRGFQDEQVVLRTDGARQNFNLAHRGRFFTDPFFVRQTEILRGGASTLFGSGALGGVVFVDTKKAGDLLEPGQTLAGEVHAGFNSQGSEARLGATLAAQQGPVDLLLGGAGRNLSEDLEDGDDNPIVDSQIDSRNYLAKLGWEPTDALRLEASFNTYNDEGQTPPNTNVQGTPSNRVNRDLEHDANRLSLSWNPADRQLVDLDILAWKNETSVRERRIQDGRFDTTDFETTGVELTNRSRLDTHMPITLAYGLELYEDEQTARRNGQARESTPDATQRFEAVFFQAELALTDSLALTPGVRFDAFETQPEANFEDQSGEQFSPRLALSWRPDETTQWFASVSRSFRAPSITELFPQGVHFSTPGFPLGQGQVFTGTNEFQPSPDLKPEESTQYEIGARRTHRSLFHPGDSFNLSANLYYARVDNFIDTQVRFIDFSTATFNPMTNQLEVNGSTTARNIDAKLYGFEGEATYDANAWFASVGLTLPRGEGRDDDRELASIPQDRLVLEGGIRPARNFEIGLRATATRDIDEKDVPEGTQTTDGSEVFDLFANWRPVSSDPKGVVFAAGIDNLSDETYRIHPSGLNSTGRAVKLSTTVTF